ncbi:MAG: rane protein [Candidatus Saccharibacteria bacterium]|nr:rane protein [Candidatus Saccharibacteria bacterium]
MTGILITKLLAVVEPTGQVNCLSDGAQGDPCDSGLPVVGAGSTQLHQILQITFGILAVIAVLMIVIAGIQFIVDSDNPQKVGQARNAIIYAVVGLVIAISAEIIVSFVLDKL